MNNAAVVSAAFTSLLVVLPLLELVSLAIVPWITDQRECFGVSVPPAAHGDQRVRRYKTLFSLMVTAFGMVCVVVSLLLALAYGRAAGFWALIASVAALPIVGFALQQAFRRKIMAIKASSRWIVVDERRAALLAEQDTPKPISLAWNLLHLVPVGITIAVGYASYAAMPARIAIHENAAGAIDGWAGKSHGLLWLAPGVQILLAVVFVVVHAVIVASKRPIDPDKPAETAYAYGLFTRVWSMYLVSCGMILISVLGLTLQAAVIGAVRLDAAGAVALVAAVAAVAGAVVLAVFYGQNGSKVFGRDTSSQSGSSDDDRFWKLGVFYVNRNDHAAIVPKRFGVGWTLNFGRPVIWLAILVFVLVVIMVPVLAMRQ